MPKETRKLNNPAILKEDDKKKASKLTNQQVINLLIDLSNTDFDNVEDGKFAYAIQRNSDKATAIVKAINKGNETIKGKELVTLEEKYAEEIKVAENKFLEGKTRYFVADLESAINTALLTTEDGPKIIELRKKYHAKKDVYMAEICDEFKPYYLTAEHVQTLPLRRSQMAVIMPLIEEK